MSYLSFLFRKKPTAKQKWLHGFISLFLIIGVSFIVIWFYKNTDWKFLINLGYLGFIAVCFFGSAVAFFPFPVAAFIGVAGLFLNPLFTIFVGGLVVSAASLISYFIGTEGKIIFEDFPGYGKFHNWAIKNTHGFWSIFLIALLPIPVFNFISMAAGILGVKWYRYFLATLLGKVVSYLVIVFMFDFLGNRFVELLPLIKSYFS